MAQFCFLLLLRLAGQVPCRTLVHKDTLPVLDYPPCGHISVSLGIFFVFPTAFSSHSQWEAMKRQWKESIGIGVLELLAHHDLAAQVEPDQMKDRLTKINADGV
jgi:hypothetical protein